MSGERGLGAAQFGIGSGSGSGSAATNNNNNNTYQQKQSFGYNCCSSSYPDIGRVQVQSTAAFLYYLFTALRYSALCFATGDCEDSFRIGCSDSIGQRGEMPKKVAATCYR